MGPVAFQFRPKHYIQIDIQIQKPLQRNNEGVYICLPVALSIDLVEVEALVDNPVPTPGRLVAGDGDPELSVKEPQEQHRQHEEGQQVPLPELARHEPVRAMCRPWSYQRILGGHVIQAYMHAEVSQPLAYSMHALERA